MRLAFRELIVAPPMRAMLYGKCPMPFQAWPEEMMSCEHIKYDALMAKMSNGN